jgi:hypothetical protein
MGNDLLLKDKIYSTFWSKITHACQINRIGVSMSFTLTLDQSVIRLHFDLLSGVDLLSIPLLLSAPPLMKYSNEYASRLSNRDRRSAPVRRLATAGVRILHS